jgi:hypothetical protein
MKLPAANEFLKLAKYTINKKSSYSHWIATVAANGKDHKNAVLEVSMANSASLKKDKKLAIKLNKHNLKQTKLLNPIHLLKQTTSIPSIFLPTRSM